MNEILLGIQIFAALQSLLAQAAVQSAQGGELTADQREALDLANKLQKNRLLASIAAKIGPDPDDAPAVGDSAANEAAARGQAGE